MSPIKVLVHGAAGNVGREVVKAVTQEPDMKLVGAVDVKATGDSLTLADGSKIPFSADLKSILAACTPDVMVDFSIAKASMPAIRIAADKGVNLVIGTTGFSADELAEMERLTVTKRIGLVVTPNFALGAVLMIHLAKIAGKFLDHVEIIELHHDKKLDAPSGTALSTARAMAAARGSKFLPPAGEPTPSRGQSLDGINIHSIRLPGLMAHQEVIFGAPGQTLRIRHDTINRECYIPAVLLAIKSVASQKGFTYGLEKLLGL
jgi:4-hydroxy-tetrahydrodipicolinate reductase